MTAKWKDFSAGARIPDPHDPIHRTGGQSGAVGRKGHAGHRAAVSPKDKQSPTGSCIPGPHGLIRGGSGQPTCLTERDAGYPVGVSLEEDPGSVAGGSQHDRAVLSLVLL